MKNCRQTSEVPTIRAIFHGLRWLRRTGNGNVFYAKSAPCQLACKECPHLFSLRRLGILTLFFVGSAAIRADVPAATADLRPVLSALIGESERNFAIHGGEKESADQNIAYFHAKPIAGMVPGSHYIALVKGSYYYIGNLTAAPSIKAAHDAFFAMPGYSDTKGTYVVEPDKAMSNAEKDVSDLLLNGNKIATYAQFHGDKECTLSIGPFVNNMAERNDQAARVCRPVICGSCFQR